MTVVELDQLVHPQTDWGLCCLLTMFKMQEQYFNNQCRHKSDCTDVYIDLSLCWVIVYTITLSSVWKDTSNKCYEFISIL